jgi:uncharacterized protein YkvS
MNYESILNRVRKAVKKIEDREISSSVHVLNINDSIDGLNGLIVILSDIDPDYIQNLKSQQTSAS